MHRGRGLGGMKGGLGTASLKLGDVVIGALAVVNAAGDIIDWKSGTIVAGARRADGGFADSVDVMRAIVTEAGFTRTGNRHDYALPPPAASR